MSLPLHLLSTAKYSNKVVQLDNAGGDNLKACLFPVVLKVPESIRKLPLSRRGNALGWLARKSVALSAGRAGLFLAGFLKGARGQPLPRYGVYWSLTHKPLYVAGVASLCPVGIDLENLKPVSQGVFSRICRKEEAVLFRDQSRETIFFRCFTAKEAVLKRHGIGLTGLDSVAVQRVPGGSQLEVSYKNASSRVEHFEIDGHLVSLTGDETAVIWSTMYMNAHGQFVSASLK